MAQFFLLLPIFILVFLIEWGFVHWIMERQLATSFWVTLVLRLSALFVGLLFFAFFELVTIDTQNFVVTFSMGMEGLANLFWIFLGIWFGSFLLNLVVLKALYQRVLSPPPPNQTRMVMGLIWGNFFSSPLLTFVAWALQFN